MPIVQAEKPLESHQVQPMSTNAALTTQDATTSDLSLAYKRVVFAICPTGKFCREDRCQSYFSFELIPSMRAPLEECESAGAIRDAGASAFIIDGPAEGLSDHDYLKRVHQARPDLIIIVTTFGTLQADLDWASRFKSELPDVPVGVRGAPCYVHDSLILEQNPSVDFCVKGEYEVIFDAVVRHGYQEAPGVSLRINGKVQLPDEIPRVENLDTLPFPDRSAVNRSLYQVRGLRQHQATIRVQRGCPFPCTYCLVHTVSGNRARHRSPQNIVNEMKQLLQAGISCFYLRADTFSVDREWAIALSRAIRSECPKARWVTTTRVDKVDHEVLQEMAAGGCYGVSFGIDVVTKSIGKKVQKLADLETTKRALAWCDQVGIISLAYVMTGFLWESAETLKETDLFLRSIRPDLLTIHFAHPYPGTQYYQDVQSSQTSLLSKRAQAEPAINTVGVSAQALTKAARGWLRRHYLRPRVLLSLGIKGSRLLLRRS